MVELWSATRLNGARSDVRPPGGLTLTVKRTDITKHAVVVR